MFRLASRKMLSFGKRFNPISLRFFSLVQQNTSDEYRRAVNVLRKFDILENCDIDLDISFASLGLDIWDHVELLLYFEEEFDVDFFDSDISAFSTVRQVVDHVQKMCDHSK